MPAAPSVATPATPPPATAPARLDPSAALGAVGLGIPLCASLVVSFASGGYFITTWGIAALVVIGAVGMVMLGSRGGVGGPLGVLALGAWVAFGAWQGLSALWASEPAASQQAMGLTALYGAAFTLGLTGLRRPGWLPWVSAAALVAVWVPASIALVARLLPGSVGEDTYARLSWPISYWNGLGAMLGFGLVLSIGIAGSPGARGPMRVAAAAAAPVFGLGLYLTLSRGAILAVVLVLLVLVAAGPNRLETVAASVVALTASAVLSAFAEREGGLAALGGQLPDHADQGRRVAIALLAAVAVCAIAGPLLVRSAHRLSGMARRVTGGLVVGLCALSLVGGWVAVGPGGDPVRWSGDQLESFRSYSSGERNDASAATRLAVAAGSGRWQNWDVAWDQWRSDPVVGSGAGDYRFAWSSQRSVDLHVVNAHSLYLEVLGETGIVGFLLLIAPLGIAGCALAAMRIRARGDPAVRDVTVAASAAGVVALHAAGDWDWQLPGVMLPAVVLGAAALRATLQVLGEDRPAGWPVRAPALVACGMAAVLVAGPAAAATLCDRARAEARAGRLEQALQTARDAQGQQANAPTPRLLQAYILTDLGRHPDADRAFAGALARSPRDWSIMADWAAALIARGDRAAAGPLLRRAAALNPLERRVRLLIETGSRAG